MLCIIAAVGLKARFVAFCLELYRELFIFQDSSCGRMRCGCRAGVVCACACEGGGAGARWHGEGPAGVQMTKYWIADMVFVRLGGTRLSST